MKLVSAVLTLVSLGTGLVHAADIPKNPTPIDFSYAGYRGGGQPIPAVAAVISVRPTGGDDTDLLQSALDHVASLPLNQEGFRGAVLLRPGIFHVRSQLRMHASGVVLRGSGSGPNGTVVIAEGVDRRSLIEIGNPAAPQWKTPVEISDELVPAGARRFHLANAAGLQIGDEVLVRRPSTAAWIKAHGMSGLLGTFADQRLDWKPGSHDLMWYRTIIAIDAAANEIEVDAPVTFLLERSMGGGTVAVLEKDGPVRNIGIEDLVLDSAYNRANPKDEEHSWIAIKLDHVEDAWVRGVTARHFVASLAHVGQAARRVSIVDSRNEAPVSEEGGYRRQSFAVYGQQVLVYRCHSELGMNDFATGLLAAGPNVFLEDEASRSLEASGSFEGLAAGVLYERVRVPDAPIQLLLDQTRAQGAGWTAVNSVIWNSNAKSLDAMGPYDGMNYTVESPQPLYETELAARGLKLPQRPAHAPHTEQAPDFHDLTPKPANTLTQHSFQIVHGSFMVDGHVAYGGSQGDAWWKGDTSPLDSAAITGSSITRFMPGQTAPGLTEDLSEIVTRAKSHGTIVYQTIPGLWYEHRRDEHTVFKQPNGDVWAPFFEMPWQRSGKGIAWDGLSRFDLTKFNPWYFDRNREFARLAAGQGLLVIHNLYNTHDVLEIGPHWIDYPWRPANNINDTGLPDPPPFKGGYTISMDTVQPTVTKLNVANEFFNVDYPPLRELHHDFIFHVLDTLGDLPNVIFTVAYQYAGPLAFEQFFQDTVAEWEKQHGHKVRIALITSKGITDAILADPVRSKQIAVVDMRYWYYLSDGTLYAPEAGLNRAFRDLVASRFGDKYSSVGPPTTEDQVYRQVREYRDRYADLVLMPSENGGGPISILMGGGVSTTGGRGRQDGTTVSNATIDRFVEEHLSRDLMKMAPTDGLVAEPERNWVLAGDATDAILIYSRARDQIAWKKSLAHATYSGLWFNPLSGESRSVPQISGREGTRVVKPDNKPWLLLLRAGS